jgi:hypothetical protein
MTDPPPWWLRLVFVLVAAQALLLVAVFFQPAAVSLLVPWPATPLNARFIAALYTSVGLGVLLCAALPTFRAVRIPLLGIALATGGLLLITLPRLGELDHFPVFWMLFYTVDPLLVAVSFWRLRHEALAGRGRNPLAPLWLAHAVILAAAGLLLLTWPEAAIALWPWALTEPLSRMYSIFFLTLAACAGLMTLEPDGTAAQPIALALALLAVLVLGVSLYHLDRFKPGAPTVVWFVLFAAEVVVLGGLLRRRRAPAPARRAPA